MLPLCSAGPEYSKYKYCCSTKTRLNTQPFKLALYVLKLLLCSLLLPCLLCLRGSTCCLSSCDKDSAHARPLVKCLALALENSAAGVPEDTSLLVM